MSDDELGNAAPYDIPNQVPPDPGIQRAEAEAAGAVVGIFEIAVGVAQSLVDPSGG